MTRNNISVIIVVAIICLTIGAIGTYFLNTSEIDNLNNEIIENEGESNEFSRFLLKAISKNNDALINEGFAKAYLKEADYYYNLTYYHWSEIYYSTAKEYFNYAENEFEEANAFLKQARFFANNDKTLNFINKYIELYDNSKVINGLNYNICDSLKLASHYYNISKWDTGDEKLIESNNYLDEYNDYISIQNDLLDEIDNLLETPWKEYI